MLICEDSESGSKRFDAVQRLLAGARLVSESKAMSYEAILSEAIEREKSNNGFAGIESAPILLASSPLCASA